MQYKYFSVVELGAEDVPAIFDTDKPAYAIINTRACVRIGIISWYALWRTWCFSPSDATIWSDDCLRDVDDAIQKIKEAAE